RVAMLRRQSVFPAIGRFVAQEIRAVFCTVEGEAHPVQRKTPLRLLAVENHSPRTIVVSHGGAPRAERKDRCYRNHLQRAQMRFDVDQTGPRYPNLIQVKSSKTSVGYVH